MSDLEGDGDLDLVSGPRRWDVLLLRKHGHCSCACVHGEDWRERPVPRHRSREDSHPTLGDLDADGDPDLLASQASGRLAYYVDDPSNLRNLEGVLDPSHSSDPLHWGKPTLADFDGDEDLDLLTHSYQAGIWRLDHYENTGTKSCPSFIVRTGGTNPFAPLAVHFGPMAFGDLDLDGDLDVVVGKGTFESFGYFENTGGTEAPAFVERTGSANPLSDDLFYSPQHSATLVDLDTDGDLDLVLTYEDGYLYLENTGSPDFGGLPPASLLQRSAPRLIHLRFGAVVCRRGCRWGSRHRRQHR
ncbi:MAG: VCBS repeat-containing protein [Deltaproteobacteria bacterium]|nr:VCBS repeat-containing protein [Deltaproteobacteria bacterium]